MNLGEQKAGLIEKTVEAALQLHANASRPFAVLELGAHFGDGTMRIVRAIRQYAKKNGGGPPAFVASFEDNKGWASANRFLLEHAVPEAKPGSGAPSLAHVSLFVTPDAILEAAKAVLAHFSGASYGLIVMDHDKKRYHHTLRGLVDAALVRPAGLVLADNCGTHAKFMQKYLKYISDEGVFATHYKEITAPYPDRVAVSVYQGGGEPTDSPSERTEI